MQCVTCLTALATKTIFTFAQVGGYPISTSSPIHTRLRQTLVYLWKNKGDDESHSCPNPSTLEAFIKSWKHIHTHIYIYIYINKTCNTHTTHIHKQTRILCTRHNNACCWSEKAQICMHGHQQQLSRWTEIQVFGFILVSLCTWTVCF